ncbi:hypothetical protein EX30DRAFT_351626 [Ascodesmis nigricans]|uniref:Zn(2)-C6 fungal-type domain-containing protein n=1 Tax=Ascodesmis nigricans TaxID=341454 RepID=A0A4S2ML93_9PEZI|nr:hypothetical protein EX30DRAFT_351626 [Ascodesmis nigricans]
MRCDGEAELECACLPLPLLIPLILRIPLSSPRPSHLISSSSRSPPPTTAAPPTQPEPTHALTRKTPPPISAHQHRHRHRHRRRCFRPVRLNSGDPRQGETTLSPPLPAPRDTHREREIHRDTAPSKTNTTAATARVRLSSSRDPPRITATRADATTFAHRRVATTTTTTTTEQERDACAGHGDSNDEDRDGSGGTGKKNKKERDPPGKLQTATPTHGFTMNDPQTSPPVKPKLLSPSRSPLSPPEKVMKRPLPDDDDDDDEESYRAHPHPHPEAPQGKKKVLERNQACLACRQRKRKCDGNKPTCNACFRLERECHYTHNSVTKIHSSSGGGAYRARIQSPGKLSEPPVVKRIGFTPVNASREMGREQPFTVTPVNGTEKKPQTTTTTTTPQRKPRPITPPPSKKASYFPTRFFQMSPFPQLAPLDILVSPPSPPVVDPADTPQLGVDDFPAHSLMLELFNLFFAQIHPLLPILHRRSTLSSLSPSPPPTALTYAILTLSSALHPSPAIRSLTSTFHHHATTLFTTATTTTTTSLSEIQAGLLLTLHLYTLGPSPTLLPFFTHLSHLLHLHGLNTIDRSSPSLLPLPLPRSEQDLEERRRTAWSVYILDRLLHLGRPSIPPTIRDDAWCVNFPCAEERFQENAVAGEGVVTVDPFPGDAPLQRLCQRIGEEVEPWGVLCRLAVLLGRVVEVARAVGAVEGKGGERERWEVLRRVRGVENAVVAFAGRVPRCVRGGGREENEGDRQIVLLIRLLLATARICVLASLIRLFPPGGEEAAGEGREGRVGGTGAQQPSISSPPSPPPPPSTAKSAKTTKISRPSPSPSPSVSPSLSSASSVAVPEASPPRPPQTIPAQTARMEIIESLAAAVAQALLVLRNSMPFPVPSPPIATGAGAGAGGGIGGEGGGGRIGGAHVPVPISPLILDPLVTIARTLIALNALADGMIPPPHSPALSSFPDPDHQDRDSSTAAESTAADQRRGMKLESRGESRVENRGGWTGGIHLEKDESAVEVLMTVVEAVGEVWRGVGEVVGRVVAGERGRGGGGLGEGGKGWGAVWGV